MRASQSRIANIIAWSAFIYIISISAYLSSQITEKHANERLIKCNSVDLSLYQASYRYKKIAITKCQSLYGQSISSAESAGRYFYSPIYEAVSLQEWILYSLLEWLLTKWYYFLPYFTLISAGYFITGFVRIRPWSNN